ncbi:hypothetical protein ACDY96_10770 [Rhizobium mongolense]|uniref:hypothetical protein n=1 Tax=Rhizobium mongolense TaxID=57676 RepID=UPI00355879F1
MMRHKLDGREYKLLLNADRFSNDPSGTVDRFWSRAMIPLIDKQRDEEDGKPRPDGGFDREPERRVRYWDTNDCFLTRADLTLRERQEAAKPAEITLKYRMPDQFVVADCLLDAGGPDLKGSFEEDIAPLEVDNPSDGERPVAIAPSRSIRSRFALSITRDAIWSEPVTLADIAHLVPSLRDHLLASGQPLNPHSRLIPGPSIADRVFKGAAVHLGANVTGKFALTLWFFDAAPPKVAEISFKCETKNGEMPGKAARRALKLFIGMQTELGDWVSADFSSKTALALPGDCGRSSE